MQPYYGLADAVDAALAVLRQERRAALGGRPLCGDVVIFPEGSRLRISYVWRDVDGYPVQIQTSDGGSWYWSASGDMDFSGSLRTPIPVESLSLLGETDQVEAWLFHHDVAGAHRSVTVTAEVAVWVSSAPAPSG